MITEQEGENITRLIRTSDLWAMEANPEKTWYYYASDEQGSTIFLTDAEGKVKNHYTYDAFGNTIEAEEQIPNRYQYTGQQLDPLTQQYYLRARFYNPAIARFTQEDEYRGDGLNLYAYCANDPVDYYDPSGYGKKCIKGVIKRQVARVKKAGYQEHHIISDKNILTKNHDLFEKAGFKNPEEFLQSRRNKIFLPKNDSIHPKGTVIRPGNGKGILSRSIHRGKHQAKVSEDLAKKMNHIYEQGELEGWNQKQYRKALFNVVSEERKN